MSEIPRESEFLTSPDWTMSLEAQEDERYERLMSAAESAYSTGVHLPWWVQNSEAQYFQHEMTGEVDDEEFEEWGEFGEEEFRHSQVYRQSDAYDKLAMKRAWLGEADWVYSTEVDSDGLWEQEVPARRVRQLW